MPKSIPLTALSLLNDLAEDPYLGLHRTVDNVSACTYCGYVASKYTTIPVELWHTIDCPVFRTRTLIEFVEVVIDVEG